MKNVISKSPLETSRHMTNHLGRKTLVKSLKQNTVAKSEVIYITGYSTEACLDPYESGYEKQAISNAIDNCSFKSFSHRQDFIPTNDPQALNPTYFQQPDIQQNILSLHPPINMYNCKIISQMNLE